MLLRVPMMPPPISNRSQNPRKRQPDASACYRAIDRQVFGPACLDPLEHRSHGYPVANLRRPRIEQFHGKPGELARMAGRKRSQDATIQRFIGDEVTETAGCDNCDPPVELA